MLIGAKRRGVTAVLSPHNCLSDAAMSFRSVRKQAVWRLILRRSLAAYDLVIATSEQEKVETAGHASGVPIAVLPNTVAPPDPATLTDVVKDRTVGFLGRLHPIKGVRELALAWALVAPLGWRLRIAGPVDDESYATELRKIARAADGIDSEAPLYDADKWRFLASCAIVAVPSWTEGFSNVAIEAYLAGTPVLTTLGVPWPQIEGLGIGWGGTGDVGGLAALLKEALATDENARARMAAIGGAWVRRKYGAPAIARQSLGMSSRAALRRYEL